MDAPNPGRTDASPSPAGSASPSSNELRDVPTPSPEPATGTFAPTGAKAKGGLVQRVRRWLKLGDATQWGITSPKKPRRVALAAPPEVPADVSILFVDSTNVCRSQLAHALALTHGFKADSMGTFPGTRLDVNAVMAVREMGFDMSQFRPKPVQPARFRDFDHVIVFGRALHPSVAPPHTKSWDVPDPKGMPMEFYRETRRNIDRRLTELAVRHGVRPSVADILEA